MWSTHGPTASDGAATEELQAIGANVEMSPELGEAGPEVEEFELSRLKSTTECLIRWPHRSRSESGFSLRLAIFAHVFRERTRRRPDAKIHIPP